jgi:branched-chain amino acid transport system ATP-binding protein
MSSSAPATSPAGTVASPQGVTILEVCGLRCAFGGVQAVDDTSFAIRRGTITGLIGPNGAGKSTVINAIGGQVRPQAGSVKFEDREVSGQSPHRIARTGITRTFQTPNLFPRLTVLENLLYGAPPWRGEGLLSALVGGAMWRRGQNDLVGEAQEIMRRFDVLPLQNEYAGALSGGQKRIVEIMRALMARPKLLLLDEPMAGVNPTLARTIAAHLGELRAEGMTMLMIEHDLRLVGDVCDPVIVMAQGRVLAEAPMADLQRNEEVVRAYLTG